MAGSALRGTKPCRVMTHHNLLLLKLVGTHCTPKFYLLLIVLSSTDNGQFECGLQSTMGLFLISPVFLHNGTTDDVESRDQIEQYSSRIHTFVQGLSSSSFIDHGSKQSRQNRVGLDLYFLQKRMYVQNGDTHFPKCQKEHKNYLNLVANIMHYLCFRNRRC